MWNERRGAGVLLSIVVGHIVEGVRESVMNRRATFGDKIHMCMMTADTGMFTETTRPHRSVGAEVGDTFRIISCLLMWWAFGCRCGVQRPHQGHKGEGRWG